MQELQTILPIETEASDKLKQLVAQAQKGDISAIPELDRLLDSRPDIWQAVGNMARHAEETLLTSIVDDNLLARESILRKLAEVRLELVGASSSPIENLLAERIGVCWLDVYGADVSAASSNYKDSLHVKLIQRRLDRAQQRYLAGLKALATTRKLLHPPLSPALIAAHLKRNGQKATTARRRKARTNSGNGHLGKKRQAACQR